MSARATLYVSNVVVSKTGKTLQITFENNQAMTVVAISRYIAEKLIAELQGKLNLGEVNGEVNGES